MFLTAGFTFYLLQNIILVKIITGILKLIPYISKNHCPVQLARLLELGAREESSLLPLCGSYITLV